MKQTTRIICITLCVLLIALSAAGVIWALYNKFASNEAHADYEDLAGTETIVNFNQQVYNDKINGSYSVSGSPIDIVFSTNIVVGHKYYIRFTIDSISTMRGNAFFFANNSQVVDFQYIYLVNDLATKDFLITAEYNTYMTRVNVDMSWSNNICIDVSAMFGVGNEPNLEQAREYFTADYYNYTTGTPMYYSNTASYSQGYAKAIQDYTNYYQINLLNYSAFSSAFVENTINNSNAFVEKYIDYEIVDYPFLKARGYLFVPFSSIAKSGSQLSFNYVDPGQGGSGDYLWCGIYYENSFIPIMYIGDLTGQKIEFITPFDTSYLVFCNSSTRDYFTFVDAAYWIGELQVSNAYLNMDEIINAAIRGYDYEIRTYYSKGYEGYETIFAEGRLAGQADTNATIGAMEYIGAAFTGIGSILQIELLPNVPFSIFILLPLMFALIAFVVKLSKGGD